MALTIVFIIIPSALIGLSLLVIAVIVIRKLSYLQKLSPETQQEIGHSFWHDLMPEFFGAVKNIRFKEFMHNVLIEIEKLIRRFRLLFSSIDRVSENLIRKIRRVHRESAIATKDEEEKTQEKVQEKAQVQPKAPERVTPPPVVVIEDEPLPVAPITDVSNIRVKKTVAPNMEALKKEEQDLIMSIARDPKDTQLYLLLGDVYTKMKNFDDALESYETVLKLQPENDKAKKKLSAVLEKISKK